MRRLIAPSGDFVAGGLRWHLAAGNVRLSTVRLANRGEP